MENSGLDVTPHALVFAGTGHGHVVGSMLLSQSLAALGFKISFLYFSSYYAKLSRQNRLVLPSPELRGHLLLPPQPSASATVCDGDGNGGCSSTGPIRFVQGSEESNSGRGRINVLVLEDGLLLGEVEKFLFVNSTMKENLYNLIVDLQHQVPPLVCLISDSFVLWTLDVAQRAGIPRIELWASNAMSHLLLTNYDVLFEEGILPENGPSDRWKRDTPLLLNHIPGLAPFSSELLPKEVRFGNHTDFLLKYFSQIGACTKSAERLLINTLSELEPAAFKAFELQGIPAYGIGPLPMQLKAEDTDTAQCLSWLSSQADSSVIYIAFGSIATLSREEIRELAMGLEASGSPFLWVLREDVAKMEELVQVLPAGFLERTSRTGMIIKWAPQVAVLAHKAVGGFLSHCGWNSTVESLSQGVPMLCCPRFAEQRLNCLYLCKVWGAGLELERTESGGLERSFVEDGVKALMWNEEVRSKAQELKQRIHKANRLGGKSFSNLQKLYDDMRALSSKVILTRDYYQQSKSPPMNQKTLNMAGKIEKTACSTGQDHSRKTL